MSGAFLDDEEAANTTALYAILNVPRTASPEDITRAYRKLAQVFHPDKHIDDEKRRHAQESFAKVQEAYEILSDSHKRQIYDIYGKAGLNAGLEVGDHLRSKEEIRREWEEFMQKQKQAHQEQSVTQKGSYVCRVDARRLVKGQGLGQGPLFRTVVAQNSVEAVVSDHDVVSLTGQAAVRPAYRRTPMGLEEVTFGGGNVVAGYKRIISEDDSLDVVGQVGLQSLISVTSTRRLCKQTNRHGWLNMSWTPQTGVGMEAGCSQALFSHKSEGSVSLVLAPLANTGVSTTLTHRGGRYMLQGKLEMGLVHSLSARCSVVLSDSLTLRLIGRLGTTGIDLECGLARKWSPSLVGYMGTVVGYPAGVVLKVRATRTGQSVECPIHLSSAFTDWKVVAASYVIPPLAYLAVSRLVVRPVLTWHKARKERVHREEVAEATRAALQKAVKEQALIEGVARRKLATELGSESGLIVLNAVYGLLVDYRAHVAQHGLAAVAAAARAAVKAVSSAGAAAGAERSTEQAASAAAGAEGASTSTQPGTDSGQGSEAAGGSGQGGEAAGGANTATQAGPGSVPSTSAAALGVPTTVAALPRTWLDVTLPVQYLVLDGQLVLHGGVPKSGLMGFTDPAPHTTGKQLHVQYVHKGTAYEVTVGDEEALALPGSAGQLITDNAQLLALQECMRAMT